MKKKQRQFKPIIHYWRKIKGDGNCFYRAVIFSYIERIILSNNKQLLANLILDLDSCFLNESILSRINIKHNFTLKHQSVIGFLIIIYQSLITCNINEAYDIFVECMLRSEQFDYALILYLRFITYRYIKNNENKLYTKTFAIQIGNLLPSEYEKDGSFLFDMFYENFLLKMFKDAEKIIIYVLPFVLCTKINIVMLELDNDPIKLFTYYGIIPSKRDEFTIDILNHKSHYDLIYTQNFYMQYNQLLTEYCLRPEYKSKIVSVINDNLSLINEDRDDVNDEKEIVNDCIQTNNENQNKNQLHQNNSMLVNKKEPRDSNNILNNDLVNNKRIDGMTRSHLAQTIILDSDDNNSNQGIIAKEEQKRESSNEYYLLPNKDNIKIGLKDEILIVGKSYNDYHQSHQIPNSKRYTNIATHTPIDSNCDVSSKSLDFQFNQQKCTNCFNPSLSQYKIFICYNCFSNELNTYLFGLYLNYLSLAKETI